MGEIRIVNRKLYDLRDDEILIMVDRTSLLGNPYPLLNEKRRNRVCDKYSEYFHEQIKNKNHDFIIELIRIYSLLDSHDVALGCWCFPQRCHAETILKFIKHLRENPEEYLRLKEDVFGGEK